MRPENDAYVVFDQICWGDVSDQKVELSRHMARTYLTKPGIWRIVIVYDLNMSCLFKYRELEISVLLKHRESGCLLEFK